MLRDVFCGAALVLFAACATTPQEPLDPSLLPRVDLAAVAFHPSEDNHCGPAALATVLQWTGVEVSPGELAGQLITPEREGTLPFDMIGATRRHGRIAYPIESFNSLLRELAAGHPVVVLQNLGLGWYPVWHYAVVVGYDLERQEMTLRSGKVREHRVSFGLFERTWKRADRWALLVLPPVGAP